MQLRSLKDAGLRGTRVLLRAGLNVPVSNGRVVDHFRIRKALPTIEFLRDRGAKVIIVSHLGRAGETMRPVFEELVHRLGKASMRWSAASPGRELLAAVDDLGDGDILMLENIRRQEGEQAGDASFAEELAKAGDIFVNDAFADSHRAHASIALLPKRLPAYAGLLMEEEVRILEGALTPLHPALAIVGGAKFETKEPLIEKLLPIYDRLLLGGAIVNDFFKAKGYEVGTSLVSGALPARELHEHAKLGLPLDIVAATEERSRETSPDDAHADERIADVGSATVAAWSKEVADARFVLWNGPLGIYEKGFTKPTLDLAHALARSSAHAVVGGGDTIAALAKTNFDPERVFLSTGGGAMLEFLIKGTLPGIELLRAS